MSYLSEIENELLHLSAWILLEIFLTNTYKESFFCCKLNIWTYNLVKVSEFGDDVS